MNAGDKLLCKVLITKLNNPWKGRWVKEFLIAFSWIKIIVFLTDVSLNIVLKVTKNDKLLS